MNAPTNPRDLRPDSTAQADATDAGFTAREPSTQAEGRVRSTDEILADLGVGTGPLDFSMDAGASASASRAQDEFAGFSAGLGAPAETLADSLPADDTEAAFQDLDLDFTSELYMALGDAWQQLHIDQDAFNEVREFKIEQPATATSSLVLFDPASDDYIRVGTRPDGVQAVIGEPNITAAQALSRAQIAMTSDRFRNDGVDQLHGTEKDKALLMLAAANVGLKIANPPVIDPEVLAEAQQEWETLMNAGTGPKDLTDLDFALPDDAAPVAASGAAIAPTPVNTGVSDLSSQEFVSGVEVTEVPLDEAGATDPQSLDFTGDGAISAGPEAAGTDGFANTVAEAHILPAADEPVASNLTADPDPLSLDFTAEPQHSAASTETAQVVFPPAPPRLTQIVSPEEAAMLLQGLPGGENYISPEAKTLLASKDISDETYLNIRQLVQDRNENVVNPDGQLNRIGLVKHFGQAVFGGGVIKAALDALHADGVVESKGAFYMVRQAPATPAP